MEFRLLESCYLDEIKHQLEILAKRDEFHNDPTSIPDSNLTFYKSLSLGSKVWFVWVGIRYWLFFMRLFNFLLLLE